MVQEWEKVNATEQKELKKFHDFNFMSILLISCLLSIYFFTEKKKNFKRKKNCDVPVIINNPTLSN